MPALKKKVQPVSKARRAAVPEKGPDGLTLPIRLRGLMDAQGVGQTELARSCSEFYAVHMPNVEERVKQQHIYNLVNGQSTSEILPLIAAVFDVNELWLQFGIGQKVRK